MKLKRILCAKIGRRCNIKASGARKLKQFGDRMVKVAVPAAKSKPASLLVCRYLTISCGTVGR